MKGDLRMIEPHVMVLATIIHSSSDAVQSLLTVRFPQLNIHFPQNSVTFDPPR